MRAIAIRPRFGLWLGLTTFACLATPDARAEFLLEHFRYEVAEDDPTQVAFEFIFNEPFDQSHPGGGPVQHAFDLLQSFTRGVRIFSRFEHLPGLVSVVRDFGFPEQELLAQVAFSQDAPNHVAFRLPRHASGFDLLSIFYHLSLTERGVITQHIDGVEPGIDYPIVAAVPEPASVAMIGLAGVAGAICGLGIRARRRRMNAA